MNDTQDAGVRRLAAARDRAATLKVDLLTLRSRSTCELTFVFEGVDDKIPYRIWIRRIEPTLEFEAFPCGGKEKVLLLRNIVERDKDDLRSKVYFFLDRDFDDLRGEPTSENLFLTETYSFENTLVSRQSLELILDDVVHCSDPSERSSIADVFDRVYLEFLSASSAVNQRLFTSKRCGVRCKGGVTDRISRIADVELLRARPAAVSVEEALPLERELTTEELALHQPEFDALEPKSRFRGKFALAFFMRWLALLMDDRDSPTPQLFSAAAKAGARSKRAELKIPLLAAYSALPSGLPQFITKAASTSCA